MLILVYNVIFISLVSICLVFTLWSPFRPEGPTSSEIAKSEATPEVQVQPLDPILLDINTQADISKQLRDGGPGDGSLSVSFPDPNEERRFSSRPTIQFTATKHDGSPAEFDHVKLTIIGMYRLKELPFWMPGGTEDPRRKINPVALPTKDTPFEIDRDVISEKGKCTVQLEYESKGELRTRIILLTGAVSSRSSTVASSKRFLLIVDGGSASPFVNKIEGIGNGKIPTDQAFIGPFLEAKPEECINVYKYNLKLIAAIDKIMCIKSPNLRRLIESASQFSVRTKINEKAAEDLIRELAPGRPAQRGGGGPSSTVKS
jgi:hypothetical protein